MQHFRGLSFPTISSVGSNAAIIHYSPEAGACAEMDPDKIYLCDSGAQVYNHMIEYIVEASLICSNIQMLLMSFERSIWMEQLI